MKCLTKFAIAFLLLLPMLARADWQVARPDAAVPAEPVFQASSQPCNVVNPSYSNSAFPTQLGCMGRPAAIYAISVSGSLKENLERIMNRYRWRVVWKAPYDFNFDGRVTGSSLPDVIERLLKPFPLQAKLFMSNRTMLVVPRN